MFFIKKLKEDKYKVDKNKLPVHIAIIPDGNGRWAKKRGLPRNAGHKEGSNALKRVVIFCNKIGVKYVTVYAFSTENWKRPKTEVEGLMELLLDFLANAEKELKGTDICIKVIGDIKALPPKLQEEIPKVVKMTENNTGLVLNIALNYGGRQEIVNAVKNIAKDVSKGKIKSEDIDEKLISSRMYTKDIPDPDLLIRTSGEWRISNFLLWQTAYTELWFTDVLWPDIKESHIIKAINDYGRRNRRFGGI